MPPQIFAHNNVRLREFGTNSCHIFVALIRSQVVRHSSIIYLSVLRTSVFHIQRHPFSVVKFVFYVNIIAKRNELIEHEEETDTIICDKDTTIYILTHPCKPCN